MRFDLLNGSAGLIRPAFTISDPLHFHEVLGEGSVKSPPALEIGQELSGEFCGTLTGHTSFECPSPNPKHYGEQLRIGEPLWSLGDQPLPGSFFCRPVLDSVRLHTQICLADTRTETPILRRESARIVSKGALDQRVSWYPLLHPCRPRTDM